LQRLIASHAIADALGADDESLRRGADVIKRKTGNQRDGWTAGILEHREIRWQHDARVRDAILKRAARRLHPEFVANPNIFQRTEETIAVRCNRAVARFPGLWCLAQMAGGALQRLRIVAFDHRRR
jgi:hypothetical protein